MEMKNTTGPNTSDTPRERALKSYETRMTPNGTGNEIGFRFILMTSVATALIVGFVLNHIDVTPQEVVKKARVIRTRFLVKEPPPSAPEPVRPKSEEDPKPKQSEPVDLTHDPEYGKEQEDVQPEVKAEEKPVRRVYGLRKVYSKGIGSGGSLSDAVVGKLGNTLNKDVDSLQATPEDLKGKIVSTTTVDKPPRIRKRVKPEYTPEMLENRIEGAVRMRVLIDIDGKVKEATALNDLGFGASERAVAACKKMEFEPALRDGQAVAVRIIITIRFKLIG